MKILKIIVEDTASKKTISNFYLSEDNFIELINTPFFESSIDAKSGKSFKEIIISDIDKENEKKV